MPIFLNPSSPRWAISNPAPQDLSRPAPVVHCETNPLIIYASACTVTAGKVGPELLQIDTSDKLGFHSMLEDLSGPKLDILIHSPGGFAEATETIVEEIRRKFGFVRFIVPSFAKSAATMMAMSGDEILIDEDAELGPIDPQMFTRNGVVPGDAIKQQFDKAGQEILNDPRRGQVWFPILQMLGPGLLSQCENASKLAKNLVNDWLEKYMFRALPDAADKAKDVADYLSSHATFMSHGRRVKLQQLLEHNVNAHNLRDDANLYRAVWELYCIIDIILTNTPVFKMFYNSANQAMVRNSAQAAGLQLLNLPGLFPNPNMPFPAPVPTPAQPPTLPTPPAQPPAATSAASGQQPAKRRPPKKSAAKKSKAAK